MPRFAGLHFAEAYTHDAEFGYSASTSVLACGRDDGLTLDAIVPTAIAADDSGGYVAYRERDDTVIARVSE